MRLRRGTEDVDSILIRNKKPALPEWEERAVENSTAFAGFNQRLQEASAEQPLPASQQAALVSQASQQTPASQQGPLQAQGPPASQAQPAATQGQSSQRQTSQQSQGEVAEATGTAPSEAKTAGRASASIEQRTANFFMEKLRTETKAMGKIRKCFVRSG